MQGPRGAQAGGGTRGPEHASRAKVAWLDTADAEHALQTGTTRHGCWSKRCGSSTANVAEAEDAGRGHAGRGHSPVHDQT